MANLEASGTIVGAGTLRGDGALVPLAATVTLTGVGTFHGNGVLRLQVGGVAGGITRRGLVTEALPTNG